jgi:hypothetical protein
MGHQGRHGCKAWLVVGLLLLWEITFGGGPRELRAGESVGSAARPTPFLLIVEEGLLSLRAQDASLKDIIEEIGRRLRIETVVQILPETRMTMAFDRLSLAQALNELRKHATIAYVERGAGEGG